MKESTRPEGTPIVVGVDGSPESILALKWADTLAPTLGASITAVIAWHLDSMYGPFVSSDWDPEYTAQQVIETALVQTFGDTPPEGLTSKIIRGQPAKVLLDLAESAQLLVVGSRGHGGFAGLLMGSVSSACAEHATCPVLVVHTAKKRKRQTIPGEGFQSGDDEPAGKV
ncbi:universal stress protein [Arthrobacter psychrochitiniphilus]|uniref:universal stress protein n=1 Tax=Arthrobacter psychrochitiniphilus TaxID=291045 RepID=UPI003F7B96F9